MTFSEPALRQKPTWRGRSHLFSAVFALPAAFILVRAAVPDAKTVATIYGTSLFLLFAISGAYHVPFHPIKRRQILRTIDHSMIYLFNAGSYTPFIWTLQGTGTDWLLPAVWGGATFGAMKSAFWPTAPRIINSAVYVALGWVSIPALPAIYQTFDTLSFMLLILGGVLYTLGAAIYTKRRPDPFPTVFGFHEIFHVLVILGAVCHYIAIWRLIT